MKAIGENYWLPMVTDPVIVKQLSELYKDFYKPTFSDFMQMCAICKKKDDEFSMKPEYYSSGGDRKIRYVHYECHKLKVLRKSRHFAKSKNNGI